jgi:hypothetical protein
VAAVRTDHRDRPVDGADAATRRPARKQARGSSALTGPVPVPHNIPSLQPGLGDIEDTSARPITTGLVVGAGGKFARNSWLQS